MMNLDNSELQFTLIHYQIGNLASLMFFLTRLLDMWMQSSWIAIEMVFYILILYGELRACLILLILLIASLDAFVYKVCFHCIVSGHSF